MLFASDFRQIARDSLTNKWPLAVGTGFVAGILGGATSGISLPRFENREYYDIANSNFGNLFLLMMFGLLGVGLVFALIAFFCGGAVRLGYCRFNRNLLDHNNPSFMDLFSKFDIFWRGFALQFLIGLYTFLWTLLFIIPGIIAGLSYAMAPYILEENPNMPINEAIRISQDMMYGNKWRLFCMQFSFIGWQILCVLTCGIGFLFLTPYMNAAHAAFFYDVSGKFNAQNTAQYQGPMYQ